MYLRRLPEQIARAGCVVTKIDKFGVKPNASANQGDRSAWGAISTRGDFRIGQKKRD
jgi:hypothetical protein